MPLDFDREVQDQRNAIIRAIWVLVQPFIGRSTTFTTWRSRNNAVAMDFAKNGLTVANIEAAWKRASAMKGEPIRELSLLQKVLERVQTAVAVEKQRAKA